MRYSFVQTDPEQQPPQRLRVSERGKQKIRQSREAKGWKYNAEDDDRPLKAATYLLEPQKKDWWEQHWRNGERQYAVSASTWKRFQNPGEGERIKFEFFNVFCQILELQWQEVAQLEDSKLYILGEPPDPSPFYGRVWYLNKLHQWIVQEQSRLTIVYGQPGIGKTALVRTFIEQAKTFFSTAFDELIWITPDVSFSDLLEGQEDRFNQPIDCLLKLLQKQRSLIVIDGWTEVLEISDRRTGNLDELHHSGQILHRLSRHKFSSFLILIGDEQPVIKRDDAALIRSVRLQGLGKLCASPQELGEDQKILEAEQLKGTADELNAFLERYDNPSILKLVADVIRVVYGGHVAEFLDKNASILLPSDFYLDLGTRFNQIWKTLLRNERVIIYRLSVRRESCSIHQLKSAAANFGITSNELAEVLYSLMNQQPLVERDESSEEFKLTPVWQKFATAKFVEENTEELIRIIKSGEIRYTELFLGYAFLPSDGHDQQARLAQTRRIITPILNGLIAKLGSSLSVRRGLEQILTVLQKDKDAKGYSIQNITALLSKLDS